VNSSNDALVRFLYSQLRKRVEAAINDLPEQERLVMTLYYYEEFDLPQIATAMGVSQRRASQLYGSSVLNLRARLRDPVGNWDTTIHVCARPPTNGSILPRKTVRHPDASEDKVP
jgi:Sigma-70, region 4